MAAEGGAGGDLLAGLTGASVMLPQGAAFATLAGMAPAYGLYSAMVPCIVAALFGSSRLMVTGPTNAISLTAMALVAPLAVVGSPQYVSLVLTLTFMVGVMQLLLGLARVGRWVDMVPHSVTVSFTAGAATLIVNSQVGTLLGLQLPRGLSIWASRSRSFSKGSRCTDMQSGQRSAESTAIGQRMREVRERAGYTVEGLCPAAGGLLPLLGVTLFSMPILAP